MVPDIQTGSIVGTGQMSGGFTIEGTGYGEISMFEMFNGAFALWTARN